MRNWQHLALLVGLESSSLVQAVVESTFGQYIDDCPGLCNDAGPNPSNWTRLHRIKDLISCKEPLLFDMNVQNSVADPNTQITIRVCASTGKQVYAAPSPALGVRNTAARLVEIFQHHAQTGSPALQVCESSGAASQTFGIFAAEMVDLAIVQEAIKTWTNGEFLKGSKPIDDADLALLVSSFGTEGTHYTNSTLSAQSLDSRDDCRAVQVVLGDGCASLASRCGISGADFTIFNSAPNFCATLKPKQYVCCSKGSIPDMRPKPSADGTCYAYTVKPGDGCWAIADSWGISQDAINDNNKNTWGWGGCDALQPDQDIPQICASRMGFPDQ